jgi:hypothetical protein
MSIALVSLSRYTLYLYKYIPEGDKEAKIYYLKILDTDTKKQICDISISPPMNSRLSGFVP